MEDLNTQVIHLTYFLQNLQESRLSSNSNNKTWSYNKHLNLIRQGRIQFFLNRLKLANGAFSNAYEGVIKKIHKIEKKYGIGPTYQYSNTKKKKKYLHISEYQKQEKEQLINSLKIHKIQSANWLILSYFANGEIKPSAKKIHDTFKEERSS